MQGEFFIQGFSEEIKFENGLMIKLYLPRHKHNEFITIFDKLFEYLEIDKYLIINDLVNRFSLLESVFEKIGSYNPLENLKWNEKDKMWENHKLFTENIFSVKVKRILRRIIRSFETR